MAHTTRAASLKKKVARQEMRGREYKAIRLALGLSQAQLAKQLDIRVETVSRRENEAEGWGITKEVAYAVKYLLCKHTSRCEGA
jgi:DNA-binding XRE family transcriptional regulator